MPYWHFFSENGKAFVQGGINSTTVSTRTKATIESTKVQFSTSVRLATNAMLGTVFTFFRYPVALFVQLLSQCVWLFLRLSNL